jgi:hypothetical protein
MPPFPIALLQPQLQNVESRQNGDATDQVTLTIMHATTTYTTIINLSPSTASSAPTTITSPTQVTPAAVQTTISITPTNADPPSSGVVVGAVLGSILGTLVLITVIYKCCYNNRSAIWIPPYSTSWDESDSDDEGSSSNRIHRRGGGGEGFDKSNRHGDRVKRPSRTRTRRSRSETLSGTTRSDRSWSRRNSRRRSKMTNNDGLLGWFFMPSTKPRHTRRSEWVGGRYKTHTTDD